MIMDNVVAKKNLFSIQHIMYYFDILIVSILLESA